MLKLRKYNKTYKTEGINISPLIDMVFILLIFFIVTAGFVKETGIEINKPSAKSAVKIDNTNLFVTLTENGTLFIENRKIDFETLKLEIKKKLRNKPDLEVVIITDENTKTGLLIHTLDECKLAGTDNISIATEGKIDD